MSSRSFVQVAALAWSYAVIALVLRSSLVRRPVSHSCGGAPPREILAALFHEAGFKNILVHDTTNVPSAEELGWVLEAPVADSADGAVRGAVADLVTCTRVRAAIDPAVIQALGARIVPPSFNPRALRGPEGPVVITVSGLGVASDSSIAAIYWDYQCGMLCAGGSVSFFAREPGGSWKPWHTHMIWVS